MKKFISFSIILILIPVILFFAGCNKPTVWSVPDPSLYSKVKTIITVPGSAQIYNPSLIPDTSRYTYDSQGRIQTVEIANANGWSMTSYSYTQNTVTTSDGNGHTTIDTLNSQGYVMAHQGGSLVYDANGYLISSRPTPGAGIGATGVSYTIDHGDIVAIQSEYKISRGYLNKVNYADIGQPYLGKQSVHLISSETTGDPGGGISSTVIYQYTYDPQGRIRTIMDNIGFISYYSYY